MMMIICCCSLVYNNIREANFKKKDLIKNLLKKKLSCCYI